MNRTIVISFAAGLFLIPSAALAGDYTTCIKIEVDTVDSGFPISTGPDNGLEEDQWYQCNSGCNATARGVRVKLTHPSPAPTGWSQTFDSDPTTGCFTWSHAQTSGFTMTVYGYATNTYDTFVRIHDGDYDDTSTYPGATYSIVVADVTPTHNETTTYYVGDYVPRWTTFASLAFGIYRYNASLADKQIHVAFDYRPDTGTSNCTSGSGFTNALSYITSGRVYLAIADPVAMGCTRTHSSSKFVIGHELGHCLLRLHANLNGLETGIDYTHNEDGTRNPDSCGIGGDLDTYSMGSKEWNVVGFKEGFPHFVSARIWNDKAQSGAYRWGNSTHDLERYGLGAGTGTGGRLENECCAAPSNCTISWDSAGTNEDWMHFLWDFYNSNAYPMTCGLQPDGLDMFNLYKQVRVNGGLTYANYFDKTLAAVDDIGLDDSCLWEDEFPHFAALNGVDNE